jgi:putative ABC transport system permease protein
VSDMHNGFGPKSSVALVYLVSAIALFVILLACINFVNISTARSVFRAKEVGLRKVIGSTKSALYWQFMSEAFILTITAFGVALILMYFALPVFNELMGKAYELESLISTSFLTGLFILIIVVTILAGFYPAIVLSSYKPVEVLSGRMQSGAKGVSLRRSLVIFQFVISGGLVLATLVALNQMNYMRNMDLGFDKEQILVLDVTRVPGSASHSAFKNSLNSLSAVESVSFNNALPGRPGWQGQWAYPESIEEGNQIDTEYMAIDESYLSTMGLTLLAGNNFDLNNKGELEDGLIINETTVKEMGWVTPENAIGKEIVSPSQLPAGIVIGVVKDYHGVGLQEKIWPKAMDYTSKDYGRYYAIRFTTGNTSDLIASTKKLWKENLGDYEFEYFFLDEDFNKQYLSEERLIQVFMIFAILTTVIAGIGLLGLVSFVVLSRNREIGIRKVLGANISSIATLLSREFVVLVVIANVLTFPLVWYFGKLWLNNFAYHTDINPTIFLITLCLTLFVAIATVVFQTIKAGSMNPVDVLKVE